MRIEVWCEQGALKDHVSRKLAVFNSEHTAIPVKGDWIIIDENGLELYVTHVIINMTKGTVIAFVPWCAVFVPWCAVDAE